MNFLSSDVMFFVKMKEKQEPVLSPAIRHIAQCGQLLHFASRARRRATCAWIRV